MLNINKSRKFNHHTIVVKLATASEVNVKEIPSQNISHCKNTDPFLSSHLSVNINCIQHIVLQLATVHAKSRCFYVASIQVIIFYMIKMTFSNNAHLLALIQTKDFYNRKYKTTF